MLKYNKIYFEPNDERKVLNREMDVIDDVLIAIIFKVL